jgi:hypothetical protein
MTEKNCEGVKKRRLFWQDTAGTVSQEASLTISMVIISKYKLFEKVPESGVFC